MIVYRLQKAVTGQGPYSIPRRGYEPAPAPSYIQIETRAIDNWADTPYEEDPHPSPFEDGLARPGSITWSALAEDEYCGFETLQQLRDWFLREPHDAQALHNMGLRITHWSIHGRWVRKGRKQLVFKRRHATRLEIYSPLDLRDDVA